MKQLSLTGTQGRRPHSNSGPSDSTAHDTLPSWLDCSAWLRACSNPQMSEWMGPEEREGELPAPLPKTTPLWPHITYLLIPGDSIITDFQAHKLFAQMRLLLSADFSTTETSLILPSHLGMWICWPLSVVFLFPGCFRLLHFSEDLGQLTHRKFFLGKLPSQTSQRVCSSDPRHSPQRTGLLSCQQMRNRLRVLRACQTPFH